MPAKLPGNDTTPRPPNAFDRLIAEKIKSHTGVELSPEEVQAQRRQANRDKQAQFKARMKAQNYSRTNIWISPEGRVRMHKMAANTSKEMVIEEALELLEIARDIWPDSDMSDIQPGKIKKILSAVPRNPHDGGPPDDFSEQDATEVLRHYAIKMKNRRLAAVKEALQLSANREERANQ